MRPFANIHPEWGVSALRLAMAIIFIAAGWLKLLAGPAVVAASFANLGIPAPGLVSKLIMGLELIGGGLLLLGVVTRWLGLLFAMEFLVALFIVKPRWNGFNDGPVELMLLAGGIMLFLTGPGKASVDELWLEKPAR